METWTIEGPHYPFLQPAVTPRPARLRIKADTRARAHELFERLPRDGLGVVGTRYPSRRALQDVHRVLGEWGPESGRIIVSGLAFGLDAEAHEAALKLGLPTVAVLASGVEAVYPAEHGALAQRILEKGGLLISENTDDRYKPYKSDFLARNRIIAGFSRAVWIAEAGDPSGALSTAHWALNQGVDVYATPFHPTDTAGAGNRRLLVSSQAFPLWSAESLRSTWMDLRLRSDQPLRAPEDDRQQTLWKILRDAHRERGALNWDELRLLWPGPAEALPALVFALEDAGHLRVESGWITFVVNSKRVR